MEEFGRRLLLSVDAEGYGLADELTQREFQNAIPRLVGEVAEAARLDRRQWKTQEGGDSLFAVLPTDTSEPVLVDAFMRGLDTALRTFNHNRKREAWLRLRAAVHFGPASPGGNGYVGGAPVELTRIRDCAAMRTALAQLPDACLAVGASDRVFVDVVKAARTNVRADEFRHVRIEQTEKGYRGEAWIWVPGADVRPLDLGDEPDAAPGEAESASGPGGQEKGQADGGVVRDTYRMDVAPGGGGAMGPGASSTVNNVYGGG
ncbi:hypothetical protein [Streptomyces sp. NPDC059209]|uniref:hypothetical protein n=1 Tax=Streptomyces sp. NPDC059209 TaxID=3346769 RepID=UPI00368678A9